MNAPALADRLTVANTTSIWPVPDMTILGGGRTKSPTLSPDLFGAIWPLIEDLGEGAGAPADYVAISMLGVAASLIGGKRRVRPFASGDWSEPCILWVAAVGDPSSNKSPAIDAATGPLRGMEGDHADDHKSLLMSHEALAQRAKMERKAWEKEVEDATKAAQPTPDLPDSAVLPDEPQRRRLLVQDSTPEAIAAILSGNPSGTLHLRDELAGWLSSFDRYSPGGREFWLEAYGGRHFTIDRRGAAKALRIPFNGVSVLGGIQPEKLASCLLNGVDDGLVARFLWAWPEAVPYRRPRQIADTARLERIYRRLDGLQYGADGKGDAKAITLTLAPKAGDIFEAWVREHQAALSEAASLFKGFCGKLKGAVLRVALVAELLKWADGTGDEPGEVSIQSIVAAIDFAETYAKPTALRVFGEAALPVVERNAAALGRELLKRQPHEFNARDARRVWGIPSLRDAGDMAAAIDFLIEAGWLRAAPKRAGENPGRYSLDYIVNPVLFRG